MSFQPFAPAPGPWSPAREAVVISSSNFPSFTFSVVGLITFSFNCWPNSVAFWVAWVASFVVFGRS
uniref:Uncharacterized protein n=1 Tax=Anguilla anguilla TaxID=7936 RepID=A0A0E9R0P2_ANGAN